MSEETPPAARSVVRIIGTSHIAKRSAAAITTAYEELQPDIIAVELDRRRLHALLDRAAGKADERLPLSMVRQVGVTGYLFAVVAKAAQKRMGGIVKVDPGVDMLAAVELARARSKDLRLVDQDILVTMRRLSAKFTWREKLRVLGDVLGAPFQRQKVKVPLDRVPDEKTLQQLMKLLKDRYPSLYEVLIVERNVAIARNIDMIVRRNPGKKVLLVVGAGHEEDLRLRLRQLEHLADIA